MDKENNFSADWGCSFEIMKTLDIERWRGSAKGWIKSTLSGLPSEKKMDIFCKGKTENMY